MLLITTPYKYKSDLPCEINKFVYNDCKYQKAPQQQNICKKRTLEDHFSPKKMRTNSFATKANPNINGNEIKAPKRTIFLNIFRCLSLSATDCTKTGCATPLIIPPTNELPIPIHFCPCE